MKHTLAAFAATLLAVMSPILAQDESNGLKVLPDKNNVLATSLVGTWVLDAELNKRLGKRGGKPLLKFVEDVKVLAGVPAAIAKKLSKFRIYSAGTMTVGDQKHAFLVTEHTGNPTIVWFREEGGDPMGNAESWNASLVPAEVQQADLLFIGGDSNNQSFTAYKRDSRFVGKLTPEAAIAEMTRLLVGGKSRELILTYCAPEDLRRYQKEQNGVDKLVEQLDGEHGKQLLKALTIVSKSTPVMSDDKDVVTWSLDIEGLPSKMSLQRIDGRWYLRDR